MQIKHLNPNKKNPRKISDKKKAALKASLDKFGDLSGFVFNRRSQQLISGHQRSGVLPQDGSIKIEVKHETPTRAFTVAEGFVMIDGERFKYREVDADPKWEAEAMLAANKHGGTWDKDILRLLVADTPDIDLEIAGFDEIELKELEIELPTIEDLGLSDEPAKEPEDESEDEDAGEDEQTDEDYLKENPGPDSAIRQENIDTINRTSAFDKVEEKMDVVGKRFVIIIDCTSPEHKDAVKEKIEATVKECGGKFF